MGNGKRVDVVLINYKRPRNVQEIVQAFREQTTPCHITLIDVPPGPEFEIDSDFVETVDNRYAWNEDFGPYSRYVPIGAFSHEFTYFHDDDMLPGRRVVEHLLQAADAQPHFGVLGQMGRALGSDGAYSVGGIVRQKHFVPVDFVVRGYFV